jgi:hypothetical protein
MRRRLVPPFVVIVTLVSLLPVATAQAYALRPHPTWMADDVVRSILRVGDVTYLAGRFTHLDDGLGNVIERRHLAALDRSGTPLPWNPGAVGNVSTLATDGVSLYVGGRFRKIDDHHQRFVAAFDLGTGAFRAWRPRPDAPVATMFVDAAAGRLFIGGKFGAIGDVARERLASLSLDDGSVLPFDAGVRKDGLNGDDVRGVVLARNKVVAVGNFVPHVQAFDADTGAILPWEDRVPYLYSTLATDGRRVYAGSGNGGGHVDAYRAADGSLRWGVKGDGNVQKIVVGPDGRVYVGGHYCRIDGVYQEFLTIWTPDGTRIPYALDFRPDCWGGVWAIEVTSDALLLGGRFGRVGGLIQRRYAQLPA